MKNSYNHYTCYTSAKSCKNSFSSTFLKENASQFTEPQKQEIITDLKHNFKTLTQQSVDNSDASYLLRDGTFLDTKGPTDKNSQHENVANYLKHKYYFDDLSESNGSKFMENYGAVRITPWMKAITLPQLQISEEQDEELIELLSRWAKLKKVSPAEPLQIATVANHGVEFLSRAPKMSELAEDYGFGIAISFIIEDYYKTRKLSESKNLKEDTRTVLLNKSRSTGEYKDKSRGKNRFERKKFSKISSSVREYNQINMNNLFKSDLLQINIPVTGETNKYTVSIKMDGVIAEIQKNIKNNQNKFEFRTVIQALTKVFNTTNIYVKCTCDDYKYNYAHWNIVNNVSVDDTAHDPGPGKGIRNPKDEKGRGCKHVLLVLANGDWLMKVASVINNYVHYAEEHLQKPFLSIIFPKLYGVEAENAVEEGLIDDDKYLDSTPGFIDAINEYGRNRGKIQKGSNKNPVAEKEKNKAKTDEENKNDK